MFGWSNAHKRWLACWVSNHSKADICLSEDAREPCCGSGEKGFAEVHLIPRQGPIPVGFAALWLNQERQLVDRQTYKGHRSVTLAEWQSLVA